MFEEQKNYGLLPNLSQINCLTYENLKESGVINVSYSLSDLLIKPGFEMLTQLLSLSDFISLKNNFVLNASMPKLNGDSYTLKSRYDGSKHQFKQETLLSLLIKLKPPAVVLPQEIINKKEFCKTLLATNIFPFVPVDEFQDYSPLLNTFGVYFEGLAFSFEQFESFTKIVSGDFTQEEILKLSKLGIQFIESNSPIKAALLGNLFHSKEKALLANCFEVIDGNCGCPTCTQKLSCAYLNYLFDHTPLLCQRYLAQHNVYFCQSAFTANRNLAIM